MLDVGDDGLDGFPIHGEVDDEARPVFDYSWRGRGGFNGKWTAESVGDFVDGGDCVAGVGREDRPIGAERTGSQADMGGHAFVAAGAVPKPEDHGFRGVLHTKGEAVDGVGVFGNASERAAYPSRQRQVGYAGGSTVRN